MLGFALLLFAAAGAAGVAVMAIRDHRDALAARAHLLEPLRDAVPESSIAIAEDGFPVLSGRLADRRLIKVELVPDTLVMRRLPQLWMVVTLRERFARPRPAFGALARATGAEFYSRVHDFPDRIDTPAVPEAELLLRGEGPLPVAKQEGIAAILRSIFADRCVKEIAATPRGVRIVRQASQGERGAHLLLRQIRFADVALGAAELAAAIADADAFRAVLDDPAETPTALSA